MDCGFKKENGWFRYRAAAIIVENGRVLFAKNELDNYYYSIGGGVHLGEKAEDAVKREVLEETGVEYEVKRLAIEKLQDYVAYPSFFAEKLSIICDYVGHIVTYE